MKSFWIKLGKSCLLWQRSGFWGGAKILFEYALVFFKAFFVRSGEVLFISGGVGDSAHYRAYNPAEELRLYGFKTAVTISDNPNLFKLAAKFQVFVFHRVIWNEKIGRLVERIKAQKKEIIFDTDDLIYDPQYLAHMDYFQKMSPAEKAAYKNGIGAEIVNDPYIKVCTTTVSYLADKLKEKNKRVIVVPNKFSESELELVDEIIEDKKIEDGFVRIIYASGTLSHNKDFATIKEALMNILEKYEKVKLVLMGLLDIPEELVKLKDRVEIIPRVPRRETYANLYKMDINLAPLEINNPFCESKSAIKFTEAGALKVPTVAVRNRTFSEAIVDGVDGFLADNADEWVDKLSRLIEDESLRREMGGRAREKVLRDYTNRNSRNEEYCEYIKSRLQA